MRKIQIFVIIFLASVSVLQAQVDVSGYARTYEGVKVKDGDFSIVQQTLNLNFEKRGEKVAFKANPMLYYYNTDSLVFRMREIYMDMYFKNFDLRVGKQQVVWGKADGVFITDIVSPLNLTEFLLPDFDEIRIGVLAAKLDYYIGNSTIEAIWKPVFTPNDLPATGSIWTVQPDFPAPPAFDWSCSKVNYSLDNGSYYLKYSTMTSNVDFDLMGAYTWDADPTMHVEKEISFDTTTVPPTPELTGLTITPRYHRLWVSGGSFSTEIAGFILRGEGAYYNGKYFQTEDPMAQDALIQKDYINYVVGLDFSIGGVKLSGQFIQKIILNYADLMVDDKTSNLATFLAHYDALRETLHLELFSYIGLTTPNALIRPKITYDFDDSFNILLGSNIFVGDTDGMFGRYQDNTMVYVKIKYNF